MSRRYSLCNRMRRFTQLFILVGLLFCIIASSVSAQDSSGIRISIENALLVPLGTQFQVPIRFENDSPDQQFGGFDFLIRYDSALVDFVKADTGQLLKDCGWEYFEVVSLAGNLIGITTIADIADGPNHPNCFLDATQGELALLTFEVDFVDSLNCMATPLRFYWSNCGDNAASNRYGDSLLVSDRVWDYYYYTYIQQDDTLPTIAGSPDSCLNQADGGEPPVRLLDFYNGVIEFQCDPWPDNRGDINLNGVHYEIADYIIFSYYFLDGLAAFTLNVEQQVAATDVNDDGITLTLDDFVYLYRVIIGDTPPIPFSPSSPAADTAFFIDDTTTQTVYLDYPDSLAAVLIEFSGDVVPTLLDDDMSIAYRQHGGSTTALIYPASSYSGRLALTQGLVLSYAGEGQATGVQVADYEGNEIVAAVSTAAFDAITVLIDDFSFDPRDQTAQTTVSLRNPGDQIGGFVIDLVMSDYSELKFDIGNPIAQWGDIVSDWTDLAAVDMGDPGSFLRLFGVIGGGATPIPISADFEPLATINLNPVDSVGIERCSDSGQVLVDFTDFSNELGQVVPGIGVAGTYTIECEIICGDVNFDRMINISDVVALICWIFGGCEPPPYEEVIDVNLDGIYNISDAVYLIAYIFAGGPAPCQ